AGTPASRAANVCGLAAHEPRSGGCGVSPGAQAPGTLASRKVSAASAAVWLAGPALASSRNRASTPAEGLLYRALYILIAIQQPRASSTTRNTALAWNGSVNSPAGIRNTLSLPA